MGEKFVIDAGKLIIQEIDATQIHVSGFECDLHETLEEHRDELFTFKDMYSGEASLTFEMKFNTELFYKLTGLYDWIYDNCPNRRVRHLMKYGKTKRVRKKNFKRALRIIGMLLDKE